MVKRYAPLLHYKLDASAGYCRPEALPSPGPVTADAPAAAVMTDLERVPTVTIGPLATMDEANQRMIAAGVRLLLVVDARDRIAGLITATDILSEKPVKYLQERGGTRGDILVRDIMTPQERLEVMDWAQVQQARVGDVVETLKQVNRQHALVVDRPGANGRQRVRGIFSATQIGRQLGVSITPTDIAQTFAELEGVLGTD